MFRSILFTIISVYTLFVHEEYKDYLTPAFHEGSRQAVRSQMPPKSVAVFFANPVRNRANYVDFHYHQAPIDLSANAPRNTDEIETIMQMPSVLDDFDLPKLESLGQ